MQEGEEAELVFIADLSLVGKFAEELLVVTGRRILNLSSLGAGLPEVLAVDLEDIDNVALRAIDRGNNILKSQDQGGEPGKSSVVLRPS